MIGNWLLVQSIFSKIIEKGALKQMTLHDKNHFIERHQYSYQENHNTVQPILLARHQIERSLEKNMFVIAVFLDLSVAFDSVEVKHILPKKLKHYGARYHS